MEDRHGSSGWRRPLKSRSSGWARVLARGLTETGISPNAISFLSIIAAFGACWFFWNAGDSGWVARVYWVSGAVCVQARLLCNLLDGMVAVEGGKRSPTGDVWNEVPDRIADFVILIGAGIGCGELWLGVIAAGLALISAYVRALGAALVGEQDFAGPLAKPQRMAVITIGALAAALADGPMWVGIALWVIVIGTALTVLHRLRRLSKRLHERTADETNQNAKPD